MSKSLNIEHWPVVKAEQIAGACEFSGNEVTIAYAHDDSPDLVDLGAVSRCVEIWQLIARPFAVSHLVLHIDDQAYAVSGHGNLAFQGRSPINLGFLFASLTELSLTLPALAFNVPDFADQGDGVIWRVLERLARCETPRQLRFEIGEQTVVCNADQTGSQLVSGAPSFEEFFESLRRSTVSKLPLRYTLSSGEAPETPTTFGDLIGKLGSQSSKEQNRWEVSAGRWPTLAPPDANFDQLRAVMRLTTCDTRQNFNAALVSIRGYGKNRSLQCEGTINADGSVAFNGR